MATGFEKFRKKALAEEPIRIEQPQVEETEAKDERREEPVRRSRSERPAAPASAAPATEKPARGRRRKEQMEGLVTVTIQLRPETKSKLDEMKFRSKRLIWELTDEAINDLYNKMYR